MHCFVCGVTGGRHRPDCSVGVRDPEWLKGYGAGMRGEMISREASPQFRLGYDAGRRAKDGRNEQVMFG